MRVRQLKLTELERREVPAATVTPDGTAINITTDALGGRLDVFLNGDQLVVRSRGAVVDTRPIAGITAIYINSAAGSGPSSDIIRVDNALKTFTQIKGNADRDKLSAGGGTSSLDGGAAEDVVVGGILGNTFAASPGGDLLLKALENDAVNLGADARFIREMNLLPNKNTIGLPQETMTAAEVETFLSRASAASSSTDAIIAIVDRNGRILGVRVEAGVDPAITGDLNNLIFAIDGAVALARTGAFFGNNDAPLTSRTIQFISQSTITEREVVSNPNITDPNSTVRGPGYVAPVGIKGHFPPNIPFTPQVDLFGIEHTNRDSTYGPGPDRILGTADDELLTGRFNTGLETIGKLFAPTSYGTDSGLAIGANGQPTTQSRGIATLPGGIPLVKNGQVVGGIGVFFPGKTGYATESNSVLSTTYDANKKDRTLEAEAIAFAAAGGAIGGPVTIGGDNSLILPIDEIAGIPLPDGYRLPAGRIDLVGIQLDVFGPGGLYDGPRAIVKELQAVGPGVSNGTNQIVTNDANGDGVTGDTATSRNGLRVADGWLVTPKNGNGVSAAEVERIVTQGIAQAVETRAAIRLPLGERAKFVFAVADLDGQIVGLYRMADATVFSIDVAVAKARNVNYYASNKLQAADQLAGVPIGSAFTNRTFRYLANPRFPTGIDGAPPGPFSQLNDGGVDPLTGRMVGAPLPASAYQSVLGYDSFNPGTNFRDNTNLKNQNGIIFFPGSAPIYRGNSLIGGFGVSGDGVDQDDVTTDAGQVGFGVPGIHLRADQIVFQGIRLPYQKFNRNPEG